MNLVEQGDRIRILGRLKGGFRRGEQLVSFLLLLIQTGVQCLGRVSGPRLPFLPSGRGWNVERLYKNQCFVESLFSAECLDLLGRFR